VAENLPKENLGQKLIFIALFEKLDQADKDGVYSKMKNFN